MFTIALLFFLEKTGNLNFISDNVHALLLVFFLLVILYIGLKETN